MKNRTVKLCFEFASKQDLQEWFDDLMDNQVLPKGSVVYRTDSLDALTPSNTFVVRRDGARPEAYRLVVPMRKV